MPILPLSEVDEAVSIQAYDPEWVARYESERTRMLKLLSPTVASIEHFGSTAVPGMLGKPIVDLLVGVTRYTTEPAVAESLEGLGYENFGEAFFAGRYYLRRRGAFDFNAAASFRRTRNRRLRTSLSS